MKNGKPNNVKKTANQILTSLLGIFRPTNGNTKVNNHQSGGSSSSADVDGIRFCYSLRHGGTRIRRELKARGTTAGINFEVLECPECGRFAAVRRDSVTGSLGILFSGKYYRADYSTSRAGQLRNTFRPVRADHVAA